MRKRMLSLIAVAAAMILLAGVGTTQADEGSWTGEIVERGCFERRGAHGPDHAECAKRCFSNGAEVGLLTEDGLLVLRANPDDDAPFEALKELAGAMATVQGAMIEEEDGTRIVTVTASEAAS